MINCESAQAINHYLRAITTSTCSADSSKEGLPATAKRHLGRVGGKGRGPLYTSLYSPAQRPLPLKGTVCLAHACLLLLVHVLCMGGGSQAPSLRFSLGCWRLTGLRPRPRDANGDALQANGEVQLQPVQHLQWGWPEVDAAGGTNGVPPKIVQYRHA